MTKKPEPQSEEKVKYSNEEPEQEAPKMDIHGLMTGLKDMLPPETVNTLLSSCKPKAPQPELCELHLVGSEQMILKILGK